MAFSDLFPKPIVLPWVRGRELSGLHWGSYSFSPQKEIYKSWIHALSFVSWQGTVLKSKDNILNSLKNGRWILNTDGFFLSSSEQFTIKFTANGNTGFSNTTFSSRPYGPNDFRVVANNIYITQVGTATATVTQTGGGGSNLTSASTAIGNLGRVIDWNGSALSGTATKVFGGGAICCVNNSSYTSQSEADLPKILNALHLKGTTSSNYLLALALAPTRPLASTPVLVSECSTTELVTLGGRSVRTQHSHRRVWEVELLLDGFVDVRSYFGENRGGGGDYYESENQPFNAVEMYDRFLDAASDGVTLYVDRDLYGSRFTRLQNQAFGGIPNEICGKIVGATSLRFDTQNGLARRYPVTLQIAEEDPYL